MKANSIQCSMQAHMHIFNRIATKNLKSISKKKNFHKCDSGIFEMQSTRLRTFFNLQKKYTRLNTKIVELKMVFLCFESFINICLNREFKFQPCYLCLCVFTPLFIRFQFLFLINFE